MTLFYLLLAFAEPHSSDSEQQRQIPQYENFRTHQYAKDVIESVSETDRRSFLTKLSPNLTKLKKDFAFQKVERAALSRSSIFGYKKDNASHAINETKSKTITNISKIETFNEVLDRNVSEILQHKEIIEWLLQDIQRGNHLLLVEKRNIRTRNARGLENSKIPDRILQILDRPVEYIQLYPNTTIESLTVQPTVKDEIVTYEDSPLVKAVKYGLLLVVNDADKAPTEVTSSLNNLMENGVMVLSDGRKIISKEMIDSSEESETFIPLHKDFRMIVMANRTGFPFLEKESSAPLVLKTGEIGTTVRAVGSSPAVTTAVMGGYGKGPHTATAIASGTAVATATAITHDLGTSTATAIASGSSIATATAHSYNSGVATSIVITSGSSVATAITHSYNQGVATATATTSGSSVATATTHSYDAGVAKATAISSGSAVVKTQAIARGSQTVIETQNRH